MAKATGLRFVTLGDSVDLSVPELAAFYSHARVRVRGSAAGTTEEFTGEPIVYAFAVPRNASNAALGEKFATFLVSTEGKAILRREGLDALDLPRIETGRTSTGMLASR